jgi:hypothetical protein
MRKAKKYIQFVIPLLCSLHSLAQKDSTQALFSHPPKVLTIHYSYLQWEGGYNGFLFNSTYIDGVGLDFIGVVFNDEVNIAFGFDQGGRNGGRVTQAFTSRILQSYSDFYLKIEPMLFPENIINLATPLKIGTGSLTYSDTSSAASNYRRHRNRPISFPFVEPGLITYVNIFPKVSIGLGLSYRIALATSSAAPAGDYSNFTFSALLRLELFTRNLRKIAAGNNNYAAPPPERFQ